MNNTLDFNRLGKVIRRDGMNYIPSFGWSLVILWAIPLVIWLISYTFLIQGGELNGRKETLGFLSFIALIIAPAKLYKDCNDSRKGIQYAMMPASTLEKFLSMFLFCVIVTPVVYMVGAIAIDTILAAFPGRNPYDGFIFKSLFNDSEQLREIAEEMQNSSLILYKYLNNTPTGFCIYLGNLLITIMFASIFMFGNMVFKKRKTSKMLGILIIIFIVIMVFYIKWIINHGDIMFVGKDRELTEEFISHAVDAVLTISWITAFIISAIMLGLTYYKIKTQKY